MSKNSIDELLSAWEVSPRRREAFSSQVIAGRPHGPLVRVSAAVLAVFLVGGLAGWRANTDDTRQMAKAHARSIVEASSR